jgi:protein ImuA
MQGLSKARMLTELRTKIEGIEKKPVLAETSISVPNPPPFLETPSGVMHEIFADTQTEAGTTLGFAFAQARPLISLKRPAVIILQLAQDGGELGVPYALGIKSFGIDPDAVVLGRTDTPVDLLWAMEEAIACRSVAAVIADIATPVKALDFTATRRLSLRAAASGCSIFVIRYTRQREASAARYRWRLASVLSRPPPFDRQAPGRPRWQVTLEKGSLGGRRVVASPMGEVFLVDWTERGLERVASDGGAGSVRRSASLSGPPPAALGDGLSQAS